MRSAFFVASLLGLTVLGGCISEPTPDGTGDPGPVIPEIDRTLTPYKTLPASIKGLTHLAKAPEVTTGSGIWVYGHYAYVGARSDGFFIVDIMDPKAPVTVAHLKGIEGNGTIYARDVDIVDQGDRLLAILAGQGTGMHVVDVSNASNPIYLATTMGDGQDKAPVHNVAVPPNQTRYVYNSRSTGVGGSIDVVDLIDPESPVIAARFGTHGCHDITFLNLPGKQRAYCAGVQATQIYDIADLTAPKLLVSIGRQDNGIDTTPTVGKGGLHHLAMPNQDGTVLILGDEWRGGGEPGGCFPGTTNPTIGSATTPIGALTFFDVKDESNPRLLSWLSPPPSTEYTTSNTRLGSCTAHFGQLIEDRPQLVMGWYTAGIVLVDFKDPSKPYIVSQTIPQGANVWDAKVHQGYVLTGDIARGLDALTFI
jgi:hypothetical protein